MPVQIPTFGEILTVSQGLGADSCAPDLWKGLVGAWPLQEPGGLTAFDVSGYRNNGTLTNMDPATDWVTTPMGRALDFDGYNDFVVTARDPTANGPPITVATWGNIRTSMEYEGIAATKTSNDGAGWVIWIFASNNLRVKIGSGGGGYGALIANITLGQWFHVGFTYDNATIKPYFNGKEAASVAAAAATVPGSVMQIGRTYVGAYFLDCQLANLGIWNRILLPSEIRSLYTNPWAMHTLRRRVQVRGAAGGGGTLAADAGAFVESGKAVSLLSSRVATAGVGSYIESGTASGLLASHVVAAALGTYTHAGTSAGLLSSRRVAAGVGSYALAGTAALPLASWRVAAGVGAYLLDGKSASLDYSAAVFKAHIAYVNMRRNLA